MLFSLCSVRSFIRFNSDNYIKIDLQTSICRLKVEDRDEVPTFSTLEVQSVANYVESLCSNSSNTGCPTKDSLTLESNTTFEDSVPKKTVILRHRYIIHSVPDYNGLQTR
ncbi:uncharacterized protein LOC124553817 [Schistocerca americana]|uniref:uncharacterized protein LOC124553817 n=1 Tax=Schistocerca americana TaxID=7009 RepID=UPI001F4F6942|nr:uncharacterized protein LOC124553817 [Schistocerca americana]